MLKNRNSIILALILLFGFTMSCKNLDDLNINPNGVDPANADLNFLLPTTIVSLGQTIYGIGFGTCSGIMQHTQQTGWQGGYNNYDWTNTSHSWDNYYTNLMNNEEYLQKAVEGQYEFHEGVARILKAYLFGLITDLWGDAPYKDALKADTGGDYLKPAFDLQKDIYMGIIADLDTANSLLSKSAAAYTNIDAKQDVLYHGDPVKWRKFANSLALRYYMRLQAKEEATARQGISKIAGDPSTYPLITVATDDAAFGFIGTASDNSNPLSTEYDTAPDGAYMRVKMASTLVNALQNYDDPRLALWANKIEIPLVLVPGSKISRIVNGKREVSQDTVSVFENTNSMAVDFDPEFAGVPISHSRVQIFNMNTANAAQGTKNPHASHLNDRYRLTADPLVKMRLMSAAEVNLILAEAAFRGWITGSGAAGYYAAGIRESFQAWGVGDQFDAYMTRAPYNGLESIIEQKWMASWTAAQEAWFDWRRTGLPVLTTGPSAVRSVLPLRWYYHADDEIAKNKENADAAIARLEATAYLGTDQSNNSAWAKMWVLQGTGKPY